MNYNIKFIWTGDDKLWYAKCDDLSITLEDGSFDALALRMRLAVQDIMENEHNYKGAVELQYNIERTDTLAVA
ncbi:MAG: DUF1902 domain-containing protein [Defluviitaleaceae bacterium]|nr:DUF1902 domain-containing protein [Defluviitaleaceae bacterium]